MDYEKIYKKLIESRVNLNRKKNKKEYFEKHHIKPKSLGGSDEKDNLVLLTTKEHFLAHLLLIKIHIEKKENYKMCLALWRMSNGNFKMRNIISLRQYVSIKENFRKIISEKLKEQYLLGLRTNYGWKHSEEFKKMISDLHKGKIISEETKDKRKATIDQMKKEGWFYPLEGRERQSIAKKGKSNWSTGITERIIECIHCHKTGGYRAISRWHGDNCPTYTGIKRSETKLKGHKYETKICPNCNFKGSGGAMKRYHFENCKLSNNI
jgi:hypothetical protein